jgi:choline kinase
LRCRIAQKNNKRLPKPPPKYNRLGIKEIKQEYVNKLVQQVQETNEDHLNWAVLQQMVINTADEVIDKEEWYEMDGSMKSVLKPAEIKMRLILK